MPRSLGLQFEGAVRLLAKHLPLSDENSRKPVLFHNIRVGVYLYENGYSSDVVLAGILHDAIEFSSISLDMLRDKFGDHAADLVSACTKDDSITDSQEKITELIKRCVRCGQDALIVKSADIIDSFKWYAKQDNQEQLQYCMRNATEIFKNKPDEFKDKIFDELKEWQNKFSN